MARQSRLQFKKRPLRRLGLGVLIAAVFGLVVSQTAPQIRNVFAPVRTASADQLTTQTQSGVWNWLSGGSAKDKRIRDLEAEVRDLARWKMASISMAQQLDSYERMLNALGEPPARGVTARVVAESNGPFSETLLANAGADQGVEEGAVALNDGGLVGRVVQLGRRSSRILLVTDFNSRVPVMGERTGLRAMLYGARDQLGALTDLPEAGAFELGERILTSGEGGVFPRGLLIGEIGYQGEEPRVLLSMKQGQGGYVRLIPPTYIPTPEENPVIVEQVVAEAPSETEEQ